MAFSLFRVSAAVLGVTLAAAIPEHVHAEEMTGKILDPVVCEANPDQRYVLYLPSNYTKDRKWPVIFCFDAGARGRMPVERLQTAAEKYGYIVAGSLNSRNGPWAANAMAAQAMIHDVGTRFSLDSQRLYTTGVSGGARVATAIALSGTAKGVIACVAGFPVLDKGLPQSIPFPFFGTTGCEDFNYSEMRRLDEELESRHARHRVVVFNGGHEWASAALFTEAVEWLDLQAMREGLRQQDESFIRARLDARRSAIPEQPLLDRWRALKSFIADFSEFGDVAAESDETDRIARSPQLKKELLAEQALFREEDDLVRRLGNIAVEESSGRVVFADKLRARAATSSATPERAMVRRAIASYLSMTRETVRGLVEDRDYERASGLLELAIALRPDDARNHWELARVHALAGDKRAAIAALQGAARAGFSDATRVETDTAFTSLRNDPQFKTALEAIEAHSEPVQLPVVRISAALASIEVRLFYLPNADGQVSALSFLRVESVLPNSAGTRSGVEVGMEIIAIEGVRIRGLFEPDLTELLQRPVKNTITLTVRDPRDHGKERFIVIPVRAAR